MIALASTDCATKFHRPSSMIEGWQEFLPPHATTNRLLQFVCQDQAWIAKQYVGIRAFERRDCELQTLKLWHSHGLQVPKVMGVTLPLGEPYLVRELISGCSLREFLLDKSVETSEKLTVFEAVCLATRHRHAIAFQQGSSLLLHPDANTGNIILQQKDYSPVWIDFETAQVSEDLIDGAARELCRLVTYVARDLSRTHLNEIAQTLCSVYSDHPELLRRMWQRTLHRPFQLFHRLRDQYRRDSRTDRITKYDVAHAIQAA